MKKMKKVKKLAQRLRARAKDLRQKSAAPNGDPVLMARADLTAEVLQEVADQLSPRPKKKLKEMVKARKLARKARKLAASPNGMANGTANEPGDPRVGTQG